MTDKIDDGGPAFPIPASDLPGSYVSDPGMSLRQYAAIHLRHPDSGTPWLDDMIRSASRPSFVIEPPPEKFESLCGRLDLSGVVLGIVSVGTFVVFASFVWGMR